MPIYEYKCEDCSAEFEALVRSSTSEVKCEKCGSARVAKKISLFGMSGVDKPFAGSASSGCSSCSKSSCTSCH